MRDVAGRGQEKVLQSNLNGAVCVHVDDELKMQRAECWITPIQRVPPGGFSVIDYAKSKEFYANYSLPG
jgi:hypothetical protein